MTSIVFIISLTFAFSCSKLIVDISKVEKKHVACIQDPDGLPLYTVTGYSTKGGMKLPVFRCSRGTTSLESFHLHLARYVHKILYMYCTVAVSCSIRFIPGSSASNVHFQAFFLEGLSRWNQARALAAVQHQNNSLRTFDLDLACKV